LSRSTRCTVKKTFEAAAEAKAHLIVQLKDNQPGLRQQVEAAAAGAPVETAVTHDHARNRDETRLIEVFDAAPAVAGTEWEGAVAAIIRVTRTISSRSAKTGLWDRTVSTAYYLSNVPASAECFATAIRRHWGIETCSHYTRDVTFGEDASRIRCKPGIFARLRTFAYNILRVNQTGTLAQDRYRAALGGVEGLLKMTVS
jgi:predicted transposase YbfD/YdcC